jgi:hypothetical protein
VSACTALARQQLRAAYDMLDAMGVGGSPNGHGAVCAQQPIAFRTCSCDSPATHQPRRHGLDSSIRRRCNSVVRTWICRVISVFSFSSSSCSLKSWSAFACWNAAWRF